MTLTPVVSKTLFIQLSITATVLGLTLINIFEFITDFTSQVASVCFLVAVSLESVPLCYQSTCLIEENQTLCNEIFYSNWIERDARFRKMLVFFIQQTQRPMQLTAGTIFLINLDTTIRIMKFSFTLYTFISTMNIKERLNL